MARPSEPGVDALAGLLSAAAWGESLIGAGAPVEGAAVAGARAPDGVAHADRLVVAHVADGLGRFRRSVAIIDQPRKALINQSCIQAFRHQPRNRQCAGVPCDMGHALRGAPGLRPRVAAGGVVIGRQGHHIWQRKCKGAGAMQTRSKFFDDMSQLMTNAMGVAQGAKSEAQTAMKGLVDRWLADRDFVTREEFDAVRAMAQKAREENIALEARLAALEGKKKG